MGEGRSSREDGDKREERAVGEAVETKKAAGVADDRDEAEETQEPDHAQGLQARWEEGRREDDDRNL